VTGRADLAARVRGALSEVPDDGYTVEDLCLVTGYTIRTVGYALRDLVDAGHVVEGSGGVYAIASTAPIPDRPSVIASPVPIGPPRLSRLPSAPPELLDVDQRLREAEDAISRWTAYAAALTTYRRAIAPRRSR